MKIFIVLSATLLLFINLKSLSQTNMREADSTALYRPLFHFTTDSNWINDPNGLVFSNGEYDLFMQYNPFGNTWGHMSWAHAKSTDLFNWKQLPLAFKENFTSDSTGNMIFSGSVVKDRFNTSGFRNAQNTQPLVAVYTNNVSKNNVGLAQNQCIAYSLDDGETWKQYANNPVLDIHLKDFRDPKVFWYSPQKKWIMVVVKSVEYKVQFYESHDLKHWKFLSEFGNVGNTDRVWECPDLYELDIAGTNQKKWVLSLSAGHPQKGFLGMQYFIGNFDGEKFVADKEAYPLYVDHGKDYYAGVTYNNMPSADKRTIMIGWANCWNYANTIPTKGFRGLYAVPRSLFLVNAQDGLRLASQPVKELNNYEKTIFEKKSLSVKDTSISLPAVKGRSLDIDFSLTTNKNAKAGICVFKNGNEQTCIYYDDVNKAVYLDRKRSGDTSFSSEFASIEKAGVRKINDKINFRILIDKCIVEVFINDGEQTITDLVFPKKESDGIEFFSQNGETVFSQIKINEISKTLH